MVKVTNYANFFDFVTIAAKVKVKTEATNMEYISIDFYELTRQQNGMKN